MVQGERLLVVEDDAATRELLTLLLRAEGWAVQAVESGEAALEAVRFAAQPAAVLCDLHLPGVCGKTLAERLRAASGAVLLAMTATARAEAVSGYDALLVKPFAPGSVEAAWRLACAEKPTVGEAAIVSFKANSTGDGASPNRDAMVHTKTTWKVATDEPVLDLATMEQLRRGMGDAAMRGFYAFALGDAGDRMNRMDAAVAAADGAAYGREAHALKGSCGMMGARAVWRLAADAEMEGLLVDSTEKVSRMRTAMGAVRLMLETLFPV